MFLVKALKSNYCKIVFVLSAVLFYFLVPEKIFYGWYSILGTGFVLLSALVLTCFIRVIKERIVEAKKVGSSFMGLVFTAVGLAALQACGIGAPICGATIGVGFATMFLPGTALNFFENYSVLIIFISMAFQILALYFMNCFKRVPCK